MTMLTRPTRPTTTQVVGRAEPKPVSRTTSEALESALETNDSRLERDIADQVFVSDGEGGFYVQPDQMLEGHLYFFKIDDIQLAASKESDGQIALYGITKE